MTEISPVSCQSRIGSDLETLVSTVAHLHPFLDAKLVDAAGRMVQLD
ncbi:hypothetical protein [Sphingomonas sp.]|nr:hypothetical protein [Sphingomonas sp.]MBX3593768.1 hypothetical protein [Sphingomonas sp.]